MSRPERTRRLRVSAAAEPFEPRQLMHSGPLLLKEAAVALSGTADLGPWGRVKLVDRLENKQRVKKQRVKKREPRTCEVILEVILHARSARENSI